MRCELQRQFRDAVALVAIDRSQQSSNLRGFSNGTVVIDGRRNQRAAKVPGGIRPQSCCRNRVPKNCTGQLQRAPRAVKLAPTFDGTDCSEYVRGIDLRDRKTAQLMTHKRKQIFASHRSCRRPASVAIALALAAILVRDCLKRVLRLYPRSNLLSPPFARWVAPGCDQLSRRFSKLAGTTEADIWIASEGQKFSRPAIRYFRRQSFPPCRGNEQKHS